jgi:hypothetical protein
VPLAFRQCRSAVDELMSQSIAEKDIGVYRQQDTH